MDIGKKVKATVIILPGRTEYIEKYNTVIKEFLDRNFSVLCIDWRGQVYHKGHMEE